MQSTAASARQWITTAVGTAGSGKWAGAGRAAQGRPWAGRSVSRRPSRPCRRWVRSPPVRADWKHLSDSGRAGAVMELALASAVGNTEGRAINHSDFRAKRRALREAWAHDCAVSFTQVTPAALIIKLPAFVRS